MMMCGHSTTGSSCILVPQLCVILDCSGGWQGGVFVVRRAALAGRTSGGTPQIVAPPAARAGSPGPRGDGEGRAIPNYCGIPGNCIFCGSPLIWEVSLVSIFSSTKVVSGVVIFTQLNDATWSATQ